MDPSSLLLCIMADHQPLSTDDALDELRSRYAELAALAGSLAHEIKNPLSVIRMNMDLLGEDFAGPQSPKERRALAKIEMVSRQCTRLENLLNDFLRFNKVSQLELTLGSLNEQTDRVLDLFSAQADEARVQIVRYLDPDLPSILLNAQTLQAALVNLIKNALEAMPDGGELILTTRQSGRLNLLEVTDTGQGMPEEIRLRLLKRAIDRTGYEGPAELGKVETLLAALDRAGRERGARLKQTLAGAVISLAGGRIRVEPAPPRRVRSG